MGWIKNPFVTYFYQVFLPSTWFRFLHFYRVFLVAALLRSTPAKVYVDLREKYVKKSAGITAQKTKLLKWTVIYISNINCYSKLNK